MFIKNLSSKTVREFKIGNLQIQSGIDKTIMILSEIYNFFYHFNLKIKVILLIEQMY